MFLITHHLINNVKFKLVAHRLLLALHIISYFRTEIVGMNKKYFANSNNVPCKLRRFPCIRLNAFFRRDDHPKYMECGDQILRNFLNGLIIHLRGPMPKKGENKTQKKSN